MKKLIAIGVLLASMGVSSTTDIVQYIKESKEWIEVLTTQDSLKYVFKYKDKSHTNALLSLLEEGHKCRRDKRKEKYCAAAYNAGKRGLEKSLQIFKNKALRDLTAQITQVRQNCINDGFDSDYCDLKLAGSLEELGSEACSMIGMLNKALSIDFVKHPKKCYTYFGIEYPQTKEEK